MRTETVDDIAERIDRAGDRYHNAGDLKREIDSRIASGDVRSAGDTDEARVIARAFELDHGLCPDSDRPRVELAGRSPRRPWWRRWGSGTTDDS